MVPRKPSHAATVTSASVPFSHTHAANGHTALGRPT